MKTAALLLLFVLLLGCAQRAAPGSQPPEGANATGVEAKTASKKVSIHITRDSFTPNEVMVSPGTLVVWVNDEKIQHTIRGLGFQSPELGEGDIYNKTFKEPGEYGYSSGTVPAAGGRIIVR